MSNSSTTPAGKEWPFPRSREGLAVIDALSEDPEAKKDVTGLTAAIGMFYGDVLTHIVPGAHWEVAEEGSPMVRISRNTSVSVSQVAQRRLNAGLPTLVMNYDHALDHIGRDEPKGT